MWHSRTLSYRGEGVVEGGVVGGEVLPAGADVAVGPDEQRSLRAEVAGVDVLLGQGFDAQRPRTGQLALPAGGVRGEQGEPLAECVQCGPSGVEPEMWHAMARLGGRDVFRAVIEPGRSVAVGEHGLGVVGDTEDEAELGEVPVR